MVIDVRRPSAKTCWAAIGVIVVGHNISADDADTLSEAVDEWIMLHPWLTRAIIAIVALHLANAVPTRIDPIHLVFVRVRAPLRRRVTVVVD
jgi:hypothetical protein